MVVAAKRVKEEEAFLLAGTPTIQASTITQPVAAVRAKASSALRATTGIFFCFSKWECANWGGFVQSTLGRAAATTTSEEAVGWDGVEGDDGKWDGWSVRQRSCGRKSGRVVPWDALGAALEALQGNNREAAAGPKAIDTRLNWL